MGKQHPYLRIVAPIAAVVVLAGAAVAQAQRSFRSQVTEAVVTQVADRVVNELFTDSEAVSEVLGGGFSNPPINLVLAGSIVYTGQNSNTTTVTGMYLETTTDALIKTIAVPDGYDSGALLLDVTASSTTAELDVQFQQSWNGDDWYAVRTATTSGAFVMLQPTASSTIGYIPGATTRRTASFSLPDSLFTAPRLKFWFTRGSNGAVVPANFQLFSKVILKDNQ